MFVPVLGCANGGTYASRNELFIRSAFRTQDLVAHLQDVSYKANLLVHQLFLPAAARGARFLLDRPFREDFRFNLASGLSVATLGGLSFGRRILTCALHQV